MLRDRPKTQIRAGQPTLNGHEQDYVLECLNSTWLTMGKYAQRFEQAFAEYIGVKHAISVMNGTAALHLALASLGIGPGDEVIIPALTFVATANAVTYCGATPVIADVHPMTWCLNPRLVEKAITPRTRAILPVHLYGVPADMAALRNLAEKHHLWLIEDAAEALGARVMDQHVGSLGHVGCFSFYGNKTITTGEGGMITTNDDALADRLRLLRGQGQSSNKRYWHEVVGFNYRMTDLQAAVGCAQMEALPAILEQRQQVAQIYQQLLTGFQFQSVYFSDTHGYWAVAVLLPQGANRDQVMAFLDQEGIETRPVFYPINHLPAYHEPGSLIATSISSHGIVLPTHAGLSEEDIEVVCQHLKEAIYVK